MNKTSIIILLLTIFSFEISLACTSAVISGKATPDGRPLLWKNRDTGSEQNAIMFFYNGKYDYVGLINSEDINGEQIWIGYNSAGFSIMNTASYNLIESDTIAENDREGYLMHMALKYCANLQDFENLLDTLQKPMGVEANFGVIDASGGAAYYETDNYKYAKIDVNDPKIAPSGYVIRTNYSFTGISNEGYGYIRYMAANELFDNAVSSNSLSPIYIQQNMSRSLVHGRTKVDLKAEAGLNNEVSKFVSFQDFIPRNITASSIVIQGVLKDENVDLTTMWTILGFPLTSVQIPIWLAGGDEFLKIVKLNNQGVALLSDNAIKLKRRVFPITKGSGKKYMDINQLYNQQQTGIMQILRPLEINIYNETNVKLDKWRKAGIDKNEMNELYSRTESKIIEAFYKEFGLKNDYTN